MSTSRDYRIGITGARGLIGWHLRCYLHVQEDVTILLADRATFSNSQQLDKFVRQCDAIVHLAGVNRGDDVEIESANPALARILVDSMERVDVCPHVLFSSSTHIDRDTPYGRSKRLAGEILAQWAMRVGACFTNLVLPHVFGEHGKPFYNSVVSTFCHQLAVGEEPRVDNDGQLELLHAQDVAHLALNAVRTGAADSLRPSGRRLSVTELLTRLRYLADCYCNGIIPGLDDELDLQLFNTLRSYLFPGYYPVQLKLHEDNRGALFEVVKTHHGGQAFLSTTRPGITRGEHFHFNKVERFLVVQGEAVIRLRRMFDERVVEFVVDGGRPCYVDIPTLHTHDITNTGSGELLTYFWSHEIFNPEQSDTYQEKVVINA